MYDVQISAADGVDARCAPRRLVQLVVHARAEGQQLHRATVTDLSTDGCKVSGLPVLDPGTLIWLKIAGITPRAAKVAWVYRDETGFEFLSPIDPYLVTELCAATANG